MRRPGSEYTSADDIPRNNLDLDKGYPLPRNQPQRRYPARCLRQLLPPVYNNENYDKYMDHPWLDHKTKLMTTSPTFRESLLPSL